MDASARHGNQPIPAELHVEACLQCLQDASLIPSLTDYGRQPCVCKHAGYE